MRLLQLINTLDGRSSLSQVGWPPGGPHESVLLSQTGKLLERHRAAKVTRKLASTVAGLYPVVVIFDECHEMFEHPKGLWFRRSIPAGLLGRPPPGELPG